MFGAIVIIIIIIIIILIMIIMIRKNRKNHKYSHENSMAVKLLNGSIHKEQRK